jgi:hypothetical protein
MLLSEHEKTEIGKNILTSASNFYGHFVGKKFLQLLEKKVDHFLQKRYRQFFLHCTKIFYKRTNLSVLLSVCLSFFPYIKLSISVPVGPSLCSSICLCLFLLGEPNCMVQFDSIKLSSKFIQV